ncbi:hypothetical protein BJV85_002061 [Clostridium acetobutylicum]|nr:hypothetical protein [Clostridium acetobutylicum]NOW12676.1 hypothetical protein [Clostridium acetobutylicum]NRY55052.1 hypothetical protein [Clostridium acetobutylicum]NRY58831.1 hypothetical protein [Clostridium acetobutylicum]NSA93138.1 hypothetical protein [Clostridium acetobutylicum]
MGIDKYIGQVIKLVYEGYGVLESIKIVEGWIEEDENRR